MSKIEHFYSKIHGWFDFDDIYTNMVHNITREDRKYNFLEVGCFKGKSTAFMAVEIANSGKDIDFYCVDHFNGGPEFRDEDSSLFEPICLEPDGLFNVFQKNIEPVKDYVKVIKKTSMEAVEDFEDEFFDFIFIDLDHRYRYVKQDIQNWFYKLKDGGYIGGHDYTDNWIGVKAAVNEFCYSKKIDGPKKLHHSWLIKK